MQNNGLERQLLDSILVSKIKDVTKLPTEKKDCVICLQDYKNEEEIITLPCTHLFHAACIKDWLQRDKSCPICKFTITNESLGL